MTEQKVLTFKKLVEFISNIETEDQVSLACAMISLSFSKEKISFAEYEMLFKIIEKMEVRA